MPLASTPEGKLLQTSNSEADAVAALSAGATVMRQQVCLKGTFMQSALTSACSVFVEDIAHHLVSSPDVNSELLLMLNDAPPRRLALFPIHAPDGTIFGGLYLMSSMQVPFASAQPDIDTFLAVCSTTIIAILQGTRCGASGSCVTCPPLRPT